MRLKAHAWRPVTALIVCIVLAASCSSGSEDPSASPACEQFEEWSAGIDATVFLDPSATKPEADEVTALLEAVEGIEFIYLDKEEAAAEFREQFADSDQILSAVDQVPTSFRVRLLDDGSPDAVTAKLTELEDHPLVLDVVLTSDALRGWPTEC